MRVFRISLLALVVLLSLTAVTLVFADDPPASTDGQPQPQIVGGQDADIGEWPWQAQLSIFPNSFCGGSILSERWALTAAHCVTDRTTNVVFPAQFFQLTVGTHKLSQGGVQTVGVDAILVPAAFNVAAFDDTDFALLHLASPITFNSKVATTTLATSADSALFAANATATATGWGSTIGIGNPVFDTLQELEVPIVSQSDCSQAYSSITSNMLCAGSDTDATGVCSGDSGGPLVVPDGKGGWIQVGIASFVKIPCAVVGVPDVYTKVSNFTSVIQATMASFNASSSDLKITKTGLPTSAPASSTITYTITVTNQSTDVSTTTTLGDALPAGTSAVSAVSTIGGCGILSSVQVLCSFGNLPPGASATVTIEAFVAPTTQGTIVNTAAVWNTYSDFLQDSVLASTVTNVTPPPPVPGVSFWGLIGLAVMLLAGVFWKIARARNRYAVTTLF